MLLVSYPEVRDRDLLPVYVSGVGMDYPQETGSYRRSGSAQILFSVQGTGELVIGGTVCPLPEGSAVYLSERVSCRFRPRDRDWTISWVTFGCGIAGCNEMLFLGQEWCLFDARRKEEHRAMIRAIYDSVALDNSGAVRASALLYGMLVELDGERNGTLGRRAPVNTAMERILAYLNEHYTTDITLEQLCTAAGGLSEQYLCRLFKQTTGMRPMEYMLRRRISAARVYLETTDLPISDVALHSGFHNTSYFYRNFRKFVGMSPLAYRQAAMGMENPGDTGEAHGGAF